MSEAGTRYSVETGRSGLTYADYCALPDDGLRYEIVDGLLFAEPSPRRAHQNAVGNLFVSLHAYVRAHGLGEVYVAPFDVILDPRTTVVPDLVFVVRDRLKIVAERGVEGASDLLVELLSPGTALRDLLPREVELRDHATAEILDVYRRYGFRRIETPALENIRLLLASDGGENEKLIFKVLKRGAKLESASSGRDPELADLGLRFDLTVPLARYYADNHAQLPDPFKAIQIGPVWRAERPQKGRFRQFTQCDIDILGVGSEVAEIGLILATCEAISALGLEHPRVRLNDRRILAAIAKSCGVETDRHGAFLVTLDKLDKIGRDDVERELRAGGYTEGTVGRSRT